MNLLSYEKYEKEFLDSMAKKFGFKDRCQLVFVQRFLTTNKDLENQPLAEVLEKDLTIKKSKDAFGIQRDDLSKIFKKLEAEGCPSHSLKNHKREIAQKWLIDRFYSQWLQEHLWEQIKAKGTRTNKMGVVFAVEPVGTMGLLPKKTNPYRDTVPLNSNILFKANLDKEGYLILLERAPSGAVFCVCPSPFAPEPRCQLGERTLPQYPPSATFTAWEEGNEQLLAVISQELPPLEWLGKSKEEALELEGVHLQGLLDYLEGVSASQVFYTEYLVTV
ncbi:MAG: hypothetical protein RLZZ338_3082 [Cyanobacteriota bacterium]|jgi:hypothetical protein